MELETKQFYRRAAAAVDRCRACAGCSTTSPTRNSRHERRAGELIEEKLTPDAREEEERTRRRLFVLQVVQPGLAGLMDGSVSTLAPLFAAAFATRSSHDALLVGLAASIGAGISMGFAEALSDDGGPDRPRPPLAARAGLRADDHASAGSGTRCPIWSPTSASPPASPSPW